MIKRIREFFKYNPVWGYCWLCKYKHIGALVRVKR